MTALQKTIATAAGITLLLALVPITRRYAVWVGLFFLTMLYLRWKRTGGK